LLPALAKDGSAAGVIKDHRDNPTGVGQRKLETSNMVEKMDAAQDLTKF